MIWKILLAILILALLFFFFWCWWRIFEKAGQPGWKALIPIYGTIVLAQEILGWEPWKVLLLLIPCTAPIFWVWLCLDLGRAFARTTGWSIVFLMLLPILGLPILAFSDDARYFEPS